MKIRILFCSVLVAAFLFFTAVTFAINVPKPMAIDIDDLGWKQGFGGTIEKIGIVIIAGAIIGTGMEETYQLTSALKYIPWGKHVPVITDARFSGVSTGACVGHVGPEALAGGPIGKLRDGDVIEMIVDRNTLTGSIQFVGEGHERYTPEKAAAVLKARPLHPDLKPGDNLPDDTRLWAALQNISGGTWAGCVYDVDKIINKLDSRMV